LFTAFFIGRKKMKLLRIKQVIEITTLSRSTIYRLIAKGEFPKGKNLSSRTVVWDELDIMNWINSADQDG